LAIPSIAVDALQLSEKRTAGWRTYSGAGRHPTVNKCVENIAANSAARFIAEQAEFLSLCPQGHPAADAQSTHEVPYTALHGPMSEPQSASDHSITQTSK
jgi:hypothetical protein